MFTNCTIVCDGLHFSWRVPVRLGWESKLQEPLSIAGRVAWLSDWFCSGLRCWCRVAMRLLATSGAVRFGDRGNDDEPLRVGTTMSKMLSLFRFFDGKVAKLALAVPENQRS